jgi:four helix bundle protein
MVIHAHVGKLVVHQVASEIAADVARLADRLTGPGAATRADQIVRSSLSVPSNIAEACGRGTIPEFRSFLMYARGSAQELRTQLEVVRRLDGDLESVVRTLESRVTLVIKMIGRLYENPPRSD